MKLTSDFIHDRPSEKGSAGSYEWWYFDAVSESGEWQIVLIFYQGCPFSPRYNKLWASGHPDARAKYFPAISISLYRRGKPVFYSMSEYPEKSCSFSFSQVPNRVSCSLGDNHMLLERNGNELEHTIELNEILPSGDELTGTLRFNAPIVGNLFETNDTNSHKHHWNLTQPRAQTICDLLLKTGFGDSRNVRWQGKGYHDHNLGSEPMKNEFTDWYWGRFHFSRYTLIYYLMNQGNNTEFKAWLLNEKNKVESIYNHGMLTDSVSNLFGLACARKITFENAASHIEIHQNALLDSGPFYKRFKSDAALKIAAKNETDNAAGISEYIRPSRIHNRFFMPLVQMRYRYVNNPHWVQKSPFFYRWTW